MRALSSLSIGLTLISGFLLLALLAEVYYLLWWKKKTPSRETAGNGYKNHEDQVLDPSADDDQDKDLLMLFGPPRSLFTIKEETNDDLESESRRSSKRRSSSARTLTPLSSPPLFTPPLSPSDLRHPLFESRTGSSPLASPPPKFRFLRDAEEKLCRRTMREEAARGSEEEEEDGSFITILVGKNNPSSSQVNPLPSPSANKSGKLISYLSSSES